MFEVCNIVNALADSEPKYSGIKGGLKLGCPANCRAINIMWQRATILNWFNLSQFAFASSLSSQLNS